MGKYCIVDLDGRPVGTDDLPAAIEQADAFRHMRHIDPAFTEFDRKLREYWTDVYVKLVALSKAL